jgi:exo-1,4-beta-D-glucosaminidase
MRRCFGSMSAIGRDTIPQFAVPWWFRTTFRSALGSGQHAQLIVNGVVGQADVWLNGHRIAGQSTVQGDYTQYSFDVTGRLRLGVNAVALQVHPNNPNRMFTLDSVDWSQIPPDNNTGIQFPVQLHSFGALGLSDAHVIQHDSATASTAALTVRAQVDNAAAGPRSGVLRATVTSPGGRSIVVRRAVSLPARARREITLTPASYPQLRIVHPRVWWPYQMGAQPLYRLRVSVAGPAAGPDVATETFGIRTITTRLVGASPLAPHGSRQFYVNGRPFVFRAGGWAENLFLHYSSADTANQIAIIRNLGLNGIRTEGKEMPADFYEQMDRAGILVDAGFQCCDAWQLQDSKLTTTHDYAVLRLSALTIGRRLRNHPSIINFSWSDNTPTPRQAAVSVAAFRQADFQEPLIASAEYKSAPGLGWSGEKEGPYDWVPPSYWYDTGHYDAGDSSRTNAGGAWAFDSEASAGATIPTIDSIDRFLSPDEQAALWQQPDVNQYHLNYEPDLPSSANGGYSFGTLHDLDQAITNRYGSWTNLGQYVEEAQLQNYETQRAEFEAYIAHSHDAQAPSTGIVYWQLNKGWPTMLWDLYNNDYDQAGSYFGAQEANHPLHAIYRYDDGSVSIDNLTGTAARGVTVQARVFDVAGHLLSDQTSNGRTVAGDGVNSGVLHPSVPAATTPPTPARTYFVELVLRRGRAVVDRNVYWLSTQSDAVDWTKTIGNPQATMTGWADLKGLRDLPAATVASTASTHAAGRGESETDVTITNTSQTSAAAFFLRADLRRGNLAGTPAGGGDEVLPVQWSDDDITLWPGESQTLHVRYRTAALRGAAPVVTLSGFNVSPHQIAARWTAAGARVKTSP